MRNKSFKDFKFFFNRTLLLCVLLIGFVFLTNIFNTGCFLFPEKKTCFFQLPWSLSIETVEYLSLHYENWAKAGSGTGYNIQEDKKLIYISNFNWVENWIDKYFFNKVSDFILSLIFISLIFWFTFKGLKLLKKKNRSFKFLGFLLLSIFFIWFLYHPTLRYGGYHLFYFLFFIPLSIILEKYSGKIYNFNKKILVIIIITIVIFYGRNIARLEKENRIYFYNVLQNVNYPLNKMSFRYQLRMKNEISENKAQKIFKNRFIFY